MTLLRSYLWIPAGCAVLAAAGALVWGLMQTPSWEVEQQFLVAPNQERITSDRVLYRVLGSLNERQILSTFVRVLEGIALEEPEGSGDEIAGDGYTHRAFASAQGYVVVLTVRGPDARAATERCRRIARIALERMERNYPVWRFEMLGEIGPPQQPAVSRILLTSALAGGLGLVLGLLAVASRTGQGPWRALD